jgi:hypothetical protein
MSNASMMYSTSNSNHKNKNSIKYQIDCQKRITPETPETKEWIELTSKIDHSSSDYKIYIGLLEKKIDIVAKIGNSVLEREYMIGKELDSLKLPTFLKYYCMFHCLDHASEPTHATLPDYQISSHLREGNPKSDLDSIRSLDNNTKFICKEKGEKIHIIIMPYILEGRIDRWKWERENFDILKNVLKHAAVSLLYAAHTIGFLHNDTHLGNILIKRTRRKTVSYDEFGSLETKGFIPVFMDYDKSVIGYSTLIVYDNIRRFCTLSATEYNTKLDVSIVTSLLEYLLKNKIGITKEVCASICSAIDKITITYVVSELPPLPNFLRSIPV